MTTTRRPALFIVTLAIFVIGGAMLTNIIPFRQVMAQRAEIGVAQQELAHLLEENGRLTQQVAALDTPIEIERIARDKLGYVRPGETAFVVIEPEASQVVYPEDDEAPLVTEERTFLQRVWDYVTGADLVSD